MGHQDTVMLSLDYYHTVVCAQWVIAVKMTLRHRGEGQQVPPPAMCAWRDVTRTRVTLMQTRRQSQNRVHKLLEDAKLKLGSVVSDLLGVTGRRIRAALLAGEHDPPRWASLALSAWKHKRPQLELALMGQCTAH